MLDIHSTMSALGSRMGTVLSTTIVRLVVAAILGGVIGLERQLRHKPAGLRTNMFICFGSAMFTVLSDQLAGSMGGDHTRVAAQIIPGIGFIGAGSILHSRGSVVGLTTAATLFVVASVGMAAGGGLYITAIFATVVILLALAVLGNLERRFGMRSALVTYEVTGASAEAILIEANRTLDEARACMQNVRVAGGAGHVRVMFTIDGSHEDHQRINLLLHQSPVFSTVASLGSVEHE
jgi:putative Mg2+ transporter-C (MgtC) family protein